MYVKLKTVTLNLVCVCKQCELNKEADIAGSVTNTPLFVCQAVLIMLVELYRMYVVTYMTSLCHKVKAFIHTVCASRHSSSHFKLRLAADHENQEHVCMQLNQIHSAELVHVCQAMEYSPVKKQEPVKFHFPP